MVRALEMEIRQLRETYCVPNQVSGWVGVGYIFLCVCMSKFMFSVYIYICI